ncbi:MAG: hypothetical protein CVU18_04030, partial [Betaproteobacteria bacterium HGW-Betaproteobacteria-12]
MRRITLLRPGRALALLLTATLVVAAGCSGSGTSLENTPRETIPAAGSPDIRNLHLSYPSDPASAIAVLWWGTPEDARSVVEYGTTTAYG